MKNTRFLAFSCPHCPLHDPVAVAWLRKEIAAYKPDVLVHLGDGHEADSASRWPTEYDWTIDDEFESHNQFLKDLRESYGGGRRVFLPGNHDANFQEIGRIDKRIRSRCNYRDPNNEPELAKYWEHPAEYEYCRKKGVFRMGQVTCGHGYESGQSADEFQSITLGVPFGLYVGGHTHRPTANVMRARRTAAVPLPYWYANAGCMRDLKPRYMKRKRSHQWGQGIVFGEAKEVSNARATRNWEAYVKIHRMGDDE